MSVVNVGAVCDVCDKVRGPDGNRPKVRIDVRSSGSSSEGTLRKRVFEGRSQGPKWYSKLSNIYGGSMSRHEKSRLGHRSSTLRVVYHRVEGRNLYILVS